MQIEKEREREQREGERKREGEVEENGLCMYVFTKNICTLILTMINLTCVRVYHKMQSTGKIINKCW